MIIQSHFNISEMFGIYENDISMSMLQRNKKSKNVEHFCAIENLCTIYSCQTMQI